jgi:signal transduction histidine kinase
MQAGLQEIALGNHTSGYATLVEARSVLMDGNEGFADGDVLSAEHIASIETVREQLLNAGNDVLTVVQELEAAASGPSDRAARVRLENHLASVTAVMESAELLFADVGESIRAHRQVDEAHEESLRDVLAGVLIVCAPVALVLPFIVLVGVGKRFANGISKLSASVNAVAGGDLSRRADIASEDEIGALAQGFNRMAEQLEISSNHLNQAVRERTEELRHTLTVLSQRNREMEEFTYAASHDLREPLRTIVAYGELVEIDLPPQASADVREEVAAIVAAGRPMQALVADLLDLSQSGRQKLVPGPCDLNALVRDVLHGLAAQIDASSAQVAVHPLPVIEADAPLFGRVLQNLISNAIKYHHMGRIPVVTISARDMGGTYRVVIADNGIGIAAEYQDQVFQAFKRLHRQDEYEGSGIGLAVCRRTVERHGGTIHVESAPGEGSRFIVTLPKQISARPSTPSAELTLLAEADQHCFDNGPIGMPTLVPQPAEVDVPLIRAG